MKSTKSMPTKDFQTYLVEDYGKIIAQHLQGRGNLSQEDLEYLVIRTERMKDERLKGCIAELIGWGDLERAEVETFFAIALEVMRATSPSRLKEAARIVEIKSLMQGTRRVDAT